MADKYSHQFTYPVRWIETQDYILRQGHVERVVEIGPSGILTNMIKQTWGQDCLGFDKSRCLHHRLISLRDDPQAIYYREAHSAEEGDGEKSTNNSSQPDSSKSSSIPDITTARADPSVQVPIEQNSTAVTHLPDLATPPSLILLVLVATRLKKGFEDLQTSKTITELAEGRSALANEVVGDVQAEFGDGIAHPDNIPISDLCQTLDAFPARSLGKPASSLLFKFLSSNLPSGYSQDAARRYLRDRWGLGPMRQDAVFFIASSKRPVTRFTGFLQAEEFLSHVVNIYFKREGYSLPQASSDDESCSSDTAVSTSAAQMADGSIVSLYDDISEPLSVLLSEHGDNYLEGIKPKFSLKKMRLYDSYWNWSVQNLEKLHRLWADGNAEKATINELAISIENQACSRSLAHLKVLQRQAAGLDSVVQTGLADQLNQLQKQCLSRQGRNPVYIRGGEILASLTNMDAKGTISMSEMPRGSNCLRPAVNSAGKDGKPPVQPHISVCRFVDGRAISSPELSSMYVDDQRRASKQGLSFAGRNVLITGSGKNSIGISILAGLLRGGARVTVTTSSYSSGTMRMYQRLYTRWGSKGSLLRVVPFNAASFLDNKSLVESIEADEAWDLDFIVPFAALGTDNGKGLQDLDSDSEVAHRAMLTNLLRMLGLIAKAKQSRGTLNRPAVVLLPLSPNHGLLGNDGLYSESKVGLQPLLAKWYSESWADYISILGVIIGWTRGTGLMENNDNMADFVEAMGARTFNVHEMADSIVTLMGGSISQECHSGPLVADIGGGLGQIRELPRKLSSIRSALRLESEARRAIDMERARSCRVVAGTSGDVVNHDSLPVLSALASIRLPRPTLPDYDEDISPLARSLEGMVDLSRVVVITGFSELGPHGNARTRWEREVGGDLSLESSVEMAWMMGLIKHSRFTRPDGTDFAGWVDAQTSEPVADIDIYKRYMATIIAHTGLRQIEPPMCDNNYDPESKEKMHEHVLQQDLLPFEATLEIAQEMKRMHGELASVFQDDKESYHVQLKAGATVMVPRSFRFNRTVAGQIPTGWSATKYGIKDDIIEQVDPVTLFSLVCTVEALLCSGIIDPYEWYQHIHISELAICIGSSMGGLSSSRQMHRDRFLDKPVKPDVLQETFINTIGAWINMLLTSCAGPIKTPVGACATSLESLDTACDLIISGKAKVALAGGGRRFRRGSVF